MRNTSGLDPDLANRLPKATKRPSRGDPTTIGTGHGPNVRRAMSVARPMLPTWGAESKVEQTL